MSETPQKPAESIHTQVTQAVSMLKGDVDALLGTLALRSQCWDVALHERMTREMVKESYKLKQKAGWAAYKDVYQSARGAVLKGIQPQKGIRLLAEFMDLRAKTCLIGLIGTYTSFGEALEQQNEQRSDSMNTVLEVVETLTEVAEESGWKMQDGLLIDEQGLATRYEHLIIAERVMNVFDASRVTGKFEIDVKHATALGMVVVGYDELWQVLRRGHLDSPHRFYFDLSTGDEPNRH